MNTMPTIGNGQSPLIKKEKNPGSVHDVENGKHRKDILNAPYAGPKITRQEE